MKLIFLLVSLMISSSLIAHEERKFKVAEEPKIGESNAFKLTKTKRSILKTGGESYLILDLISSHRDEGKGTYTEFCAIAWTHITPVSVTTGTERVFIKYEAERKEGSKSVHVKAIDGTDEIELGGLTFGWSYGTGILVYIYPEPGTEYATVNVEQDAALKSQGVE